MRVRAQHSPPNIAAHPECGLAILGQARLALDGGETAQAVKLLNELWDRDHGFVESNAAVLLEGLPAEKASAAAGALLGGANGELSPDLSSALMVAFNPSGQAATNSDLAPPAMVNPDGTTSDGTDRTAQEDYAAGHFEQCAHRLGAKPAVLSAPQTAPSCGLRVFHWRQSGCGQRGERPASAASAFARCALLVDPGQ